MLIVIIIASSFYISPIFYEHKKIFQEKTTEKNPWMSTLLAMYAKIKGEKLEVVCDVLVMLL